MIRTFKHAGLKRYFETGKAKGIPADMSKRIRTANYRLTFRFENNDGLDLNLEDYH